MDSQKLIEKLSEEIVMIDEDNKHALGDLHNLFEELAEKLDSDYIIKTI